MTGTEGNQFQNYETTEKRISKFTKVFTITTFAICSIVLLRPFYTSLIMVLFGTFDPQNVSIPFRATWVNKYYTLTKLFQLLISFSLKRYPFNQTVPPGLFISAAIEIAAGYKFCAVFCAISTFYIGITWYIETCVNEIPTIYKKINKFLNSASRRYINSTAGRYFLKKHLLEIVQFHWKILWWDIVIFYDFKKMYYRIPMFYWQFCWKFCWFDERRYIHNIQQWNYLVIRIICSIFRI